MKKSIQGGRPGKRATLPQSHQGRIADLAAWSDGKFRVAADALGLSEELY